MPTTKQLETPLLPELAPSQSCLQPPKLMRIQSDPTCSTSASHVESPLPLHRAYSDPALVQLFSLPLLRDNNRYRIIANGFITFFALVLYQHAVYDVLTFSLHYTEKGIFSASLVIGCTFLMVITRSIEFLVNYEREDDNSLSEPTRFFFGLVDEDLRYFRNRDCSFVVWKYRFFVLRILKYNFNALLISAIWVGGDNFLNYIQYRITDYEIGPRLLLDLFLAVLSNLILVALGQLSGQFGVYDDNAVLAVASPKVSTAASPPSPTSPQKKPYRLHIPTKVKVIATLFAVVVYWYWAWDMFSSLPTEEIVKQSGEGPGTAASKDHNDDGDDDGREHRSVSRRLEYIFITVGIGYCMASAIVLVVSGELFAFINRDDDEEVVEVQAETSERMSSHLQRFGLPESISLDFACRIGNKAFLPLRLIQYNILGIFGVVAWIGMDMVILGIANLLVYDHHHGPEARYTLNIAYIILANILLTWTKQFGNQFGGNDRLKSQHEIICLETPMDVTVEGRKGSDSEL